MRDIGSEIRDRVDESFGERGIDISIDNQNNLIEGSSNAESLDGGFGNDTIRGIDGNDTINGEFGNDNLYGGAGNDIIDGGFGNNLLSGSTGNDVLTGGFGNDQLEGGKDNDRLFGQFGNDNLIGYIGDDYLAGYSGDDTLTGGTGADTFFFAEADEISEGSGVVMVNGEVVENEDRVDTLNDFNVIEGDKILIHGSSYDVGVGDSSSIAFDNNTGILSVNGERVVEVISGVDTDVLAHTQVV